MVVRVELGVPWKLTGIDNGGADGDGSTAYSVNPVSLVTSSPSGYSSSDKAGFYRTLVAVETTGERINPVDGKTSIGSVTVRFTDTPDNYFATLFASHLAQRVTKLNANQTRGATSINVVDSLVAGSAYEIGSEVFVSQASTSTPNVTRGDLAGRAVQTPHTLGTTDAPRADTVYDRPRIWRGKHLLVWYGFDPLVKSDEQGPYRYVISGPPRRLPGGLWEVRAESYLRILKKQSARNAFTCSAASFFGGAFGTAYYTLHPTNDGDDTQPGYNAANDRIFLMAGKEVIEAEVQSAANALTTVAVQRRQVRGTKREDFSQQDEVREVIPTDTSVNSPRIGRIEPTGGSPEYPIANLVASDHPLVILLNLLLSRDGPSGTSAGDNVETSGTDRCYDVLPPPWGIGVPAANVDLATLEGLIEETPYLRMPGFMLGHKGAFSVFEWWSKECAPYCGLSLYMTSDGKISAARTLDTYPQDSAIALTLDDIDERYHGYDLNHVENLGRLLWSYHESDGERVNLDPVSVLVSDLYPDEVRVDQRTLLGADELSAPFIQDRAISTIRREEFPRPTWKAGLRWKYHAGDNEVKPGSKVTVTDAGMPDIASGGYGVTADVYKVLSATPKLRLPDGDRPGSALVEVDVMRAADKTGHIAPSALVTAHTSSSTSVTFGANNYTPTSTDLDLVPVTDVASFDADQQVMFIDTDGVKKTTNTLRISSIGANSCVLNKAPADGGGDISVNGFVMVLDTMTATLQGLVDAGTVDETQDDYLHQGDTDGEIDTGVPNYVWGG